MSKIPQKATKSAAAISILAPEKNSFVLGYHKQPVQRMAK